MHPRPRALSIAARRLSIGLLPLVLVLLFQATASFGAPPGQALLAHGTYDGDWNGTTSQNKSFSFTVASNVITRIETQFVLPGCTVTETLTASVPIAGNTFSASIGGVSIQGTFSASWAASGTAHFTSSNPFCTGGVTVTWNAFNTSPPPTETTIPTQTPMPTQTSTPSLITIGDFFFAPQAITISPNGSIRWQNTGQLAHTVTSPGIGDVVLQPGETYEFAFLNAPPGTYNYFCRFHSTMTGSITISSAAAPTPIRVDLPLVVKQNPPTPTPTVTTMPSATPTNGPGRLWQVSVNDAFQVSQLTCRQGIDTIPITPRPGYALFIADVHLRNTQQATVSSSSIAVIDSGGTRWDVLASESSGSYCPSTFVTQYPAGSRDSRFAFAVSESALAQPFTLQFADATPVNFTVRRQ